MYVKKKYRVSLKNMNTRVLSTELYVSSHWLEKFPSLPSLQTSYNFEDFMSLLLCIYIMCQADVVEGEAVAL